MARAGREFEFCVVLTNDLYFAPRRLDWPMLLRLLFISGVFLAAGCQREATTEAPPSQPNQPNFLLIVVDDMGYGDIGSFGGEIETPNLDRLAYDGIRLANFHTAPTCSPTRSMLLTGVDAHKAGLGNMLEELAPNQKGQPGYEGQLNDRVVTVASLLRDAGYRTMLTGKWHLGLTEETRPIKRGFDQSFVLLPGGASHFKDMRPAYAPNPDAKAAYLENNNRLDALPEGFEYSSQFYVDKMIDYLDQDGDPDQPFFAYLSFTAPHWPLQAPDAALERQSGLYDQGFDVVAQQRLERQKALGLVPASAEMIKRSPKGRAWEDLSEEEQKTEARAMEVYAAMIAEIDRHTGRLIDHLETSGELQNTVIIFMSDNGAEGHDLDETWSSELYPKIRKTIDETHDFSYDSMGKPGSYTLYGPNWARAGSPAFNLFKAFPTEGGTRVAAFVHYPRAFPGGGIRNHFASVKDITPTLLELAGLEHPGNDYQGRTVEPMSGVSLVSALTGDEAFQDHDRVVGLELFGKMAIRQGDWKLVHMPPPYGTGEWQLFDLSTDLGESRDLAAQRPDKLAELKALWKIYETENQVIRPDWVSGY